jgi:antitoxin YefM
MDVLGFSDARARLGALMDAVVADHNPVAIARRKAEAVVLVSLADWRALEETGRLLSNPRNASRLGRAVSELDAD